MSSELIRQDDVTIRFAGDSGDGMQLTGSQFTNATAKVGNDLATFPDFPSEIRAPAGTRAGVSGFQIHFSSIDIHTPADQPDTRPRLAGVAQGRSVALATRPDQATVA